MQLHGCAEGARLTNAVWPAKVVPCMCAALPASADGQWLDRVFFFCFLNRFPYTVQPHLSSKFWPVQLSCQYWLAQFEWGRLVLSRPTLGS